MMPVGPLMIEHRLIEQMIKLMAEEVLRINQGQDPSLPLLNDSLDFIQNYADRCHHGKEEDILFKALAQKTLSDEHRRNMNELIQDHVKARGMTRELIAVKERYEQGDPTAVLKISQAMQALVVFYPPHIEKEDKQFFLPVMEYFDRQEQDTMLAAFAAFDQQLVHERFRGVVQKWKRKISPAGN